MKTIPLTDGFEVIVDDEDYKRFARHSWYASGKPPYVYACTNGNKHLGEPIYAMHRLITRAPKGMVVDHINRNTLDNRRANLRVCTQSQNLGNAKPDRRNNKTGFKGVSWRPDHRKFAAQIKVNRKTKHLGFFATPEAASAAYQAAAAEAFFSAPAAN